MSLNDFEYTRPVMYRKDVTVPLTYEQRLEKALEDALAMSFRDKCAYMVQERRKDGTMVNRLVDYKAWHKGDA